MPLSPFLYLIVLRNILKILIANGNCQKILSLFILHYPIDKRIKIVYNKDNQKAM